MKSKREHRLGRAFWLCAGSTAVFVLGISTGAHAGDKPAKTEKAEKPARKSNVPKKMLEALEEKNGKPLTDEQKDQVVAAIKTQSDAKKAADDNFNAEVGKIFGWTADDTKEALKPKPKPATPPAAAPATDAAKPATP
jgi:hypothetical protein